MKTFMIEVSEIGANTSYFIEVDADSKHQAEHIVWSKDDELTIWNVREKTPE